MSASRRDFLRWRFWGPVAAGGPVRIDPGRCLAWNRSFCSTCVERCPVPGAIRLIASMPQVTEACTGCRACVALCPAPEPAID